MTKEETDRFNAYYNAHAVCPDCGTPIGHNMDAPVDVHITGYDGNRARCPNKSCTGTKGDVIPGTGGERLKDKPWEGVVHDLVPAGKSKAETVEEGDK